VFGQNEDARISFGSDNVFQVASAEKLPNRYKIGGRGAAIYTAIMSAA